MLALQRRAGNGIACIWVTDRADGDWSDLTGASNRGVTLLDQVHGNGVVRVVAPGDQHGTAADAAWTTEADAVMAVRVADCVPIALYGTGRGGQPGVAVLHAGWRGLLGGVVTSTTNALRRHGIGRLRAIIGPHICAQHYEFGEQDLAMLVSHFGAQVAGRTTWGTVSLDLGRTVRQSLEDCGVSVDTELHRCTASDTRYFSHRARGERNRSAVLITLRAASTRSALGEDRERYAP